jgi:hypothetical protein
VHPHAIAIVAIVATIGLLVGNGSIAVAQKSSLPEQAGAERTIALFDQICYETTPDFSPLLARAKSEKWKPLKGKRLKAFAPEAPTSELKAWQVKDRGGSFFVSIITGDVDPPLKEAMPAFANAKAASCSLNLPGKTPVAEISKALQALIGRPPDDRWDQAPLTANTWIGVTDNVAALVYHYFPKTGKPGGLISVVVLSK